MTDLCEYIELKLRVGPKLIILQDSALQSTKETYTITDQYKDIKQ